VAEKPVPNAAENTISPSPLPGEAAFNAAKVILLPLPEMAAAGPTVGEVEAIYFPPPGAAAEKLALNAAEITISLPSLPEEAAEKPVLNAAKTIFLPPSGVPAAEPTAGEVKAIFLPPQPRLTRLHGRHGMAMLEKIGWGGGGGFVGGLRGRV
jgi:hypothetical protein